eukprot:scaffold109413_cov51-Phaeocystis_antarctica.AAC.1
MLDPAVVHVRRQPGAAEASEAQCHARRSAAHVGSGRRGGRRRRGGGLQRRQGLTDLPGARSQVRLLLPQLGEQRLGAELGVRQPQSTDGLQEAVGHARRRRATLHTASKIGEEKTATACATSCATHTRSQVWGGNTDQKQSTSGQIRADVKLPRTHTRRPR